MVGVFAAILILSPTMAFAAHLGAPDDTTYGDNPNCVDIDATWTELKNDDNPQINKLFNDGVLFVDLMYTGSGPDSVMWTTNIGVDAVIVKGGNQGANVYLYDPEATTDSGLVPPSGGISHVTLCYDEDMVGGTGIQIDKTAMLLVGAQMNAAWMIPVIVSGIGFAIVIARKF